MIVSVRFLQRVLASSLALMLIMSVTPRITLAGETVFPSMPANLPALSGMQATAPAISLEQAIHIIKDNFNIPQDFSKFTSGYNTYNDRQTWSLQWSAPDGNTGNFAAQVDVNTGEVVSMNKWINFNKSGPTLQIPSIQASEAKEIASKFVSGLAKNKIAEIQILPMDETVIPLANYGPISYTVRWQRIVNGIPFPSNGITVQVNAADGDILSYNLMWSSVQFPDAKNVIASSRAQDAFLSNPMLEMQYIVPAPIKPLAIGEKQKPQLVYQLNGAYVNGAIDALTGEPVKIGEGQWYGYDRGGAGGMGSAASPGQLADKTSSPPLSPEEQREIEKTANLMDQSEAENAVKRWLKIPENLVLRNSNLGTDWSSPDRSIWTLEWFQSKPDTESAQSMYARVDAANGELLGFNIYYPFNSGSKSGLDRSSARNIAEDFLKKIQAQRFQEVKLIDETYLPGMKGPVNGSQENFNYYRIVNGVPFRNNGINITVDTATQQIINYNLNWSNLDFLSLTGSLSGKEAGEVFLKARPLTLMYTQVFNPSPVSSKEEIRLIYQPQAADGSMQGNFMDAKTGEFIDWQGRPVSKLPKAYHFNDIAGNFAEKEISILGQAGILGDYGNSFRPDEEISVVSLLRAMLAAKNGIWANYSQTDEKIIKEAKQQGWITGDLLPSGTVTRDMMVRLMMRFLQLDHLAQIEGIYQVPFKDVQPGSQGYVTLASGLGMLHIDGEEFEPGRNVLRNEAAYALVKALIFQHS